MGPHRLRDGLRHVPALQQAPAHPDQRAERLPAQPRAARRAAQDGPGGRAGARGGARLWREGPQGPHLAPPARRPVVHRMRPLHGVLPRLDDRQDALAKALHGGPARPDRGGRDCAGGRGGSTASGQGRRGRRRRSIGQLVEPGARAGGGGAVAAAGRPRHPRGGGLAMHHLRLVRGGLPGADRARRQHRRDPAQPRPRGEPLPEGAQRRLPQHGDRRQPMGPAEELQAGLGEGDGRPGPGCGGRWHHQRFAPGRPLLGGMRGRLRRPQPKGRPRHGRPPEAGRCALRRPRAARDLQRRPGAAGGQRVPLPDARRGERGDPDHGPRRPQRPHHRRQLPALLQHDQERISAVRPGRGGGGPSHAAARRPGRRWTAHPGPDQRGGGRLPRCVLPGPLQRGL